MRLFTGARRRPAATFEPAEYTGTEMPIVTSFRVERQDIDYDNAEVAEALAAVTAGRLARLPLAPERFTVELAGVPTAVANALRRTAAGELPGARLTFDHADFRLETTDPFMSEFEFVRRRLQNIPLRPQISEDVVHGLRYSLHAENPSGAVAIVYAGDLVPGGDPPPPIFNPTHEIAFLQPGCSLWIENIRLERGYARAGAGFLTACRAALRPLDVAEIPRSATHGADGDAQELSGYAESSQVADPRRHAVSATVPAVPAGSGLAAATAVAACEHLVRRLGAVRKFLDDVAAAGPDVATYQAGGATWRVTLEGDRVKATLGFEGTHTLGNLLARLAYEDSPGLSFAGYNIVDHEGRVDLTLADRVAEPGELAALARRAADRGADVFAQIAREIRALA